MHKITVSNKGKYSQTSCKRPPQMSSLGGQLQEVVAYESSDHKESKFWTH